MFGFTHDGTTYVFMNQGIAEHGLGKLVRKF